MMTEEEVKAAGLIIPPGRIWPPLLDTDMCWQSHDEVCAYEAAWNACWWNSVWKTKRRGSIPNHECEHQYEQWQSVFERALQKLEAKP